MHSIGPEQNEDKKPGHLAVPWFFHVWCHMILVCSFKADYFFDRMVFSPMVKAKWEVTIMATTARTAIRL